MTSLQPTLPAGDLLREMCETVGALHRAAAGMIVWADALDRLSAMLRSGALSLRIERDDGAVIEHRYPVAPDPADTRVSWTRRVALRVQGGASAELALRAQVPAEEDALIDCRLSVLQPHVESALSILCARLDHQQLSHEHERDAACTPYGRFALTSSGRLIHANTAGRRMVDAADGLECRDGRLTATSDEDREALDRAIQRACTHELVPPEHLLLRRPSGQRPYVVRLAARPDRPAMGDRPAHHGIEVIVLDRSAGTLAPDALALWGLSLTPAEDRVLRMLVGGMTIASTARALGLARGTVKLHVEHLMKKFAVHRQADLIARALAPLLACLPPPASAPDRVPPAPR